MSRKTKREMVERAGGTRHRMIQGNTLEYYDTDGNRTIRLHDTDIIRFTPEAIIVDSGGWQTPTTRNRLNNHVKFGWRFQQEKSIWYATHGDKTFVFRDGMHLKHDGKAEGAGEKKDLNALKKKIKTYVDGYCEALFARQLNPPGPADCFYCWMRTVNTNLPLGDVVQDQTHLLSHFDESYYVPSLLVNAAESIPTSRAVRHSIGYYLRLHDSPSAWERFDHRDIPKILTRYLRKNLGMAR